jgi:MFS family permease
VTHFSPFRLLTLHYAFFQTAVALAGGFVGAYLMKLGFSLPAALIAYAGLLTARFGLRILSLGIVRRVGYRTAMALGAALMATQYFPLMRANEPLWLLVWLLVVSLAESLYWPVYHSAAAVTGGDASRGRELGIRTALGALIGVVGPLLGGVLLDRFGAVVDFSLAAVLSLLSVLPLLGLRNIPAGPVPTMRDSMQGIDRSGIAAFAADGWMASGLALAWPMVLFTSLGSQFEAFGLANAAAGLVGVVTGLTCGRAIDRGQRDRYLTLVCSALVLGFALRACASWSPVAATIANASGAAVAGLYVPILMSVIYDRAKQSGAAYRFHFAAEAGWDAGAATGCVAGAIVAWMTMVPSLALLPASLGIWAIYRCVRGQATPKPALGMGGAIPAK